MKGTKRTTSRRNPKQKRLVFGRYIVADPAICHGALTFRGTRIFVSDVLEQVEEGMDWDEIVWEWRGSVKKPAIAAAVRLARRALLNGKHARKPAA